MYHETTQFIIFTSSKKKVQQIFLKFKLQIIQLKTSISMLRFTKYFLTSSALKTLVPPNLCLLFVLFSNTKYFECFVLRQPNQIKHFKSLSKIYTNRQCTEPGFWPNLAGVQQIQALHHSITDKSSSFESMYLFNA